MWNKKYFGETLTDPKSVSFYPALGPKPQTHCSQIPPQGLFWYFYRPQFCTHCFQNPMQGFFWYFEWSEGTIIKGKCQLKIIYKNSYFLKYRPLYTRIFFFSESSQPIHPLYTVKKRRSVNNVYSENILLPHFESSLLCI